MQGVASRTAYRGTLDRRAPPAGSVSWRAGSVRTSPHTSGLVANRYVSKKNTYTYQYRNGLGALKWGCAVQAGVLWSDLSRVIAGGGAYQAPLWEFSTYWHALCSACP